MAAGCVYGDRQMQTWRAGRGFSCRRRLVRTLDAVTMGTRAPTRRPQRHTTRAISATGFSMPFSRVCPKSAGLIVKLGDFRAEFDEGGGLQNRCRCERKSWILQVLISRTLSVCGEVAERLKAAVC